MIQWQLKEKPRMQLKKQTYPCKLWNTHIDNPGIKKETQDKIIGNEKNNILSSKLLNTVKAVFRTNVLSFLKNKENLGLLITKIGK